MDKDLVLEACRLDIKSRVVRHSTGCTAKQCSLCNPRLWSTGTAHQRGDHTSFLRSEDNASAPSMTSQSHVVDSFRMQGRKEGRKEGRNGREEGSMTALSTALEPGLEPQTCGVVMLPWAPYTHIYIYIYIW